MQLPRIVAFRLVTPTPDPSVGGCLAVLTIEDGPWIVAGMRLHVDPQGEFFLKPPRLRAAEDRIVFRTGSQREAVMSQAKIMARGFLAAHAASPLATAPELTEPSE